MSLFTLELCAGGGGQAIGLEMAGFECAAAVEIEPLACATLKQNRPRWQVIQADIKEVSGQDFKGVDLLAAGVPCPPFSIAGKQLGANDDRDLFPEALRLIEESNPSAVLLENVPGFASAKFRGYREKLVRKLHNLGYEAEGRLLNASHFGVPQLRPRYILVALKPAFFEFFAWPAEIARPPTVGETIVDLMAANNWPGAIAWAGRAAKIAPTVVGGSKKHGGPDLGPTRARKQWRELGVDGLGIADAAPALSFPVEGFPRLTVRMAARIQSFPDDWAFAGKKTAAYRQVGNALPPKFAFAVAKQIRLALERQAIYHSYPVRVGETMRLLDGYGR
jgi:DNA (cytosine-5)-methyltransferase 1